MGQKWAQFMVNLPFNMHLVDLPFNMHLKPEEEKKNIYCHIAAKKKKKKIYLKGIFKY